MVRGVKKFIIYLMLAMTFVQPVLGLAQAKAADTSTSSSNATTSTNSSDNTLQTTEAVEGTFAGDPTSSQPTSLKNFAYKPAGITIVKPSLPSGYDALFKSVLAVNPDPDKQMGMGLEDGLSVNNSPRLILNPNDAAAIKTLNLLTGSDVLPDFTTEFPAMFALLSADTKSKNSINSADDLKNISLQNPNLFASLVSEAQNAWLKANGGSIQNLIKTNPQAISQILNMPVDDVSAIVNYKMSGDADAQNENQQKYDDLINQLNNAINGLKIDVRVLKLLVYLVTPKSQGGAGHWRIQVADILSGYTNPLVNNTKESDTIFQDQLGQDAASSSTQNLTAADLGQNMTAANSATAIANNSTTTQTSQASTTTQTTSSNIDEEEATFSQTTGTTDTFSGTSAHTDGEAVDISQIDDIRCTLIKLVRIGHSSKTEYSQRPIKLAWQTQQGYDSSGGAANQEADMANLLKDYASEGIQNLISQFGGSITNYSGNLSDASFSDMAMLLGQSIFGQILNSPDGTLKGYNFSDTLNKMGAMYFADFLGLPRSMFVNKSYDSLDQIEEAIGQAAIESRLQLPAGTFDGYNLDSMLKTIGQRKIEYEMNLQPGDLDNYFPQPTDTPDAAVNAANAKKNAVAYSNKNVIIGEAVIENALNLNPGSYSPNNQIPRNFSDLEKAIGKDKSDIIFRDPLYADGLLHLDPGTTAKLKSGQMTPTDYAIVIGQNRLNNTAYGFQFLPMQDTAHGMTAGTFNKIMQGDAEALTQFGITVMSNTFMTTDNEKAAFAQWVSGNRTSTVCDIANPIQVNNVTVNGATVKTVTIPNTKATAAGMDQNDLAAMFGCKTSNGQAVFNRIGSDILYYTVAEQALNPQDQIKVDLTKVNPVLHSSNPQLQFYLDRINTISTTKNRIKTNWSDTSTDPQYIAIQTMINGSISNIESLFSNPASITDITGAQTLARGLAINMNTFYTNMQALSQGANRYVNKVNGTLIDIQTLIKATEEILEGRAIPTSNDLTLAQIPNGIIGTTSAGQSTAILTQPAGTVNKNGITPTNVVLMAVLSRKISPKQFFVSLAATKLETELGLPTNSLIYFVNNYESKGLDTKEAFMAAVGQAQIEQTFGMPQNYFQGPILTGGNYMLTRPDFNTDLYSLEEYLNAGTLQKLQIGFGSGGPLKAYAASGLSSGQNLSGNITFTNPNFTAATKAATLTTSTFDNIFNTNGTTKTNLTADEQATVDTETLVNQLLWVKITNQRSFAQLVAEANANFSAEMQTLISDNDLNLYYENTFQDVVTNVTNFKLENPAYKATNDGAADILSRMGISGSLSALQSGSSVAWLAADTRAQQIDKLLGIPIGSTRDLIQGTSVGFAGSKLSTQQQQQLTAKMDISPTALNKLLQVLNGQLPATELDKSATDITAAGDNPYFSADKAETGSNPGDDCSTTFGEQTTKNSNGTSSSFLTSTVMINNAYLYFDQDGSHSFGSQTAALNYASEHTSRMESYNQEILNGINKVLGITPTTGLGPVDVQNQFNSYVSGSANDALTDAQYTQIQTTTGISKTTLQMVFHRSTATDADKPLVAYKKLVGNAVLNQVITGKLFQALGLNVNSTSFTASDFFDIMHGNYQVLEGIAAAVIDDDLNLPDGSIESIIESPSADERNCAMAEIGANVLGGYLGVNYISLHGNIYQNFGRANIEKVLNIPRNTFVGQNVPDLVNSVGEINFVNAFSIPVVDTPTIDNDVGQFFDPTFAKSIQGFSLVYKLNQIQTLLNANMGLLLQGDKADAYNDIKNQLDDQIKYAAASAIPKTGAWRQTPIQLKSGENFADINKFLARLDSLDGIFNLPKNTTINMLAGVGTSDVETYACGADGRVQASECSTANSQPWCSCQPGPSDASGNPTAGEPVTYARSDTVLTPDDYVNKVSATATENFGLLLALNLFGDNSDPANAVRNTAVVNVVHILQKGAASNKDLAALFADFEQIFSFNLDAKAGLDNGTFAAIIQNPGNTFSILMPQATKELDKEFGLSPTSNLSFTYTYQTYFGPYVNSGAPVYDPLDHTLLSPGTPAAYAAANKTATRDECALDSVAQQDVASLNARIKTDQDYINAHPDYQVLYQSQNGPTNITVTQANDPHLTASYNSFYIDDLNDATAKLSVYDSDYNACKAANRGVNPTNQSQVGRFQAMFNWNTIENILEDDVSVAISNNIADATGHTIIMPPSDVKKFFINGDMRYFYAAGLAYAANQIVDAATGSTKVVPPAYQISYADVVLATVGDPGAEQNAADAVTYQDLSLINWSADGDSYDKTLPLGNDGDINTSNNTFLGNIITSTLKFDPTGNSQPTIVRNSANLVGYQESLDDQAHGIDPTKQAQMQVAAEAGFTKLQNQYNACATADNEKAAGAGTVDADTAKAISGLDCNNIKSTFDQINLDRINATGNVRQSFQTQMEFREIDALLYSKDPNIYPGFTYALVEGSAQMKAQAIGQYIRDGIINSEFFGQKISVLENISVADKIGALSLLDFGYNLTQCNSGNATCSSPEQAFDNFAKSGGYTWFENYVSTNSNKWFGFNLPANMVGGLLLGTTTGHWGSFTNSDPTNNYKGLDGKLNIPTLGSAMFSWGSTKIFTWADQQLGWKPGTALLVYTDAKQIYDAYQTVQQLNNIEDVMDANNYTWLKNAGQNPNGYDFVDDKTLNDNPLGKNALDQAKGDPDVARNVEIQVGITIAAQLVSTQIDKFINRTWGNQISGLEKQFGLVPGSLTMLIDTEVGIGVTDLITMGVNAYLTSQGMATISYLGPAGQIAALIMFVAINLFGVYKTELLCDADGYYPQIESPSPNLDSASGLGVWDGMNSATMTSKTIAAAQYKAKTLISDALTMHDNPNYSDVYPSEIMTARDEDVVDLNQEIADNMCSVVSKSMPAVHGMCDGNSKAGVWANPYVATQGYTHIGF